ncbi:centromere-associated protein E [Pyrus ussuriensis x Pyrus communis]|uniref:Centromere-associated protein E n=1 Tax=Pyrus ussuriensis x Pyrus communis TaxID=2448454 RepID=A0A5N5FZ45_9ROSA|nr:centromere-associated protein E [Pyrus ussuriensis x Pyrus communis]
MGTMFIMTILNQWSPIIHVTVRARPLSAEDAKTSPWRISGNSIAIPNYSKFEFDRIFGEDCKTFEVYESKTKDIVAAAVRGFNGTVFAYGQTNSGKTHTIRGSATEPGVIPLAVRDMFDIIQEDVDREFLLRMSYMEIYNEDINDLLAPEHRKLQIHESLERGIYVAGLREEIVASPEQVLDLMEFGESHRHIGETNMNLYSSRSHTIFRMIIESRDKHEGEDIANSCDAVRVSVLNLVDLAGSERAAKTGAEGVRLKEGSHINKSLMTLGTVIKKLSEGAESQGGHVPYRDSKLTRILQPALGGNANTAIICNITLAQIHADETKSSLQFASRALRVTNCAHVNEILTDAALLKRQKKEIEELRAKLQESHSEHWAEEILNLRNTLLQTELERERIALELEEEKKAQAEREKMVQQQAKKIENLSSMVLYSNRDENRDRLKKEKRRDTWCPGKLARETLGEVASTIQSKASAAKPMRLKRDIGPLLPFEELVHEIEVSENESCKEDEESKSITLEDCALPDPCALLHVTNRRKVPPRTKSLPLDNELGDLQAEYEDLLIKYETQRTLSEIQIDCLTRKLAEADMLSGAMYNDYSKSYINKGTINGDNNGSLREPEVILVIKRLQEQIKMLETEKSSSQQNLDSVVELATEQNICAQEKFDELYEELQVAREEARVARDQHSWNESVTKVDDGSSDFVIELAKGVQEIILEVRSSEIAIESVSSVLDEVSKSFSVLFDTFLDFKSLMCELSLKQKTIISDHEKLNSYMMQKVSGLETEKFLLYNQSVDLQNQIEELKLQTQNSEQSLREMLEQQDLEKGEYISHIQVLEKEISGLSSCSLAKEKENLRKDVEKTRMKLKETECKLKNAIQEKTKLEGEKASAEREIKRLHSQNSLLERDMNKRESLAGRRRDSVNDKGLKTSDPKRAKNLAFEQTLQEEYKKMEVDVFEMETKINALEEELSARYREKEDAIKPVRKLSTSSLELEALQEELLALKQRLEESTFEQQKMEVAHLICIFHWQQLTNSLLEMEEETAIRSAKEKASIEAMEEKSKLYNMEITSLTREMSEVRNELDSCRQECKVLRERLTCCEETAGQKTFNVEKSLGIDQLNSGESIDDILSKQSQEMLSSNWGTCGINDCEEVNVLRKELSCLSKEREGLLIQIKELSELSNDYQNLNNQLHVLTIERDNLVTQIQEHQKLAIEEESLNKRYNDLLLEAKFQVEELTRRISSMELKTHKDQVENSIDKAKLRMRLRGAQAKLDAFRSRYKDALDESNHMNRKYEEATVKLKDLLASKGVEVLGLKKQLAAAKSGHEQK